MRCAGLSRPGIDAEAQGDLGYGTDPDHLSWRSQRAAQGRQHRFFNRSPVRWGRSKFCGIAKSPNSLPAEGLRWAYSFDSGGASRLSSPVPSALTTRSNCSSNLALSDS